MFKLALMLEMSWIYSIIITFKRTSLMMIMSTLYRWVKDFSALCTDYDVNVLETDRGYYMVAQRYEISLRVLKNISRVSAVNKWNIFQHEKRTFVSPSSHVIFYLLYKHQWITKPFPEMPTSRDLKSGDSIFHLPPTPEI